MRTFFYLAPLAPGALPYRGHCPLPISMLAHFQQPTYHTHAAPPPPPIHTSMNLCTPAISMTDRTSTIFYPTGQAKAAAFAMAFAPTMPYLGRLPQRALAASMPS
jgi:hypothetical protein